MPSDTARARMSARPAGPEQATRSAALVGRVVVPANGKLGRTRVRILGRDVAVTFECEGGTWERFGLAPGPYRVELVADRLVLAKQIELAPGDEAIVDFEVR